MRALFWFGVAFVAAAGCAESDPVGLADGGHGDAPVADAGQDSSEQRADSSAMPALDVTFACVRSFRVDARWKPVAGADRYLATLDDGTVIAESIVPEMRLRRGSLRGLEVTALAGAQVLARARFGLSDRWTGDMAYLRARRGAETSLEAVGCLLEREAEGETTLAAEQNAVLFPGAAPVSLSGSASLVEIEPDIRSRLIFRDANDTFAVDPAEPLLAVEPFASLTITSLARQTAFVSTTASNDYVIDDAGDVRGAAHGGSLMVWVSASELAPLVASSISPDVGGGVWIVATGGEAPRLLYRASAGAPLEDVLALPDATPTATYVFDAMGGLVANPTSGRLFVLSTEGDAGARAWRDTGIVIPGLRSMRTTESYVLATGGPAGNELFVLDRVTMAPRGHYVLEGTEDLELVGYEPRREARQP